LRADSLWLSSKFARTTKQFLHSRSPFISSGDSRTMDFSTFRCLVESPLGGVRVRKTTVLDPPLRSPTPRNRGAFVQASDGTRAALAWHISSAVLLRADAGIGTLPGARSGRGRPLGRIAGRRYRPAGLRCRVRAAVRRTVD